ncbi:polysaccharide deacetylase family protein [Niameybacter massiliensis]|uniref:Polysaccharide deacetylase family protein n=1 Tax=Holtiella tumoricola TaxID=3018743 RepID=A0AA42DK93_9FIRM|nr:polysaccharide deacetylase family protein [Holtiella tumoricola]MDA3730551.1 polysaccharide deacetylase family protein [Holtiella tumoricola]
MAKRNNQIGITILLIALSLGLFAGTGFLASKSSGGKETLTKAQEELTTVEASKANLEVQVQELETKNEQLLKQIEELNIQIQELEKQGVDVSVITEEQEDRKVAYLTFDDGPSANTTKILDFLKANQIRATFFVLEKDGYDDLYKRIVDEGHSIAIHSSTHDYAEIYQNVDNFMADVQSLSKHIKDLTGVETKVLRFPGGSNNTVSHRYGGKDIMDKIIPAVTQAGYVYYDWNVDSQDAAKGLQDTQVIVNSVLNQAKYNDNAVILMHDAAAKTTTVEALPQIVEGLKQQGFVFEALSPESEPVKFK